MALNIAFRDFCSFHFWNAVMTSAVKASRRVSKVVMAKLLQRFEFSLVPGQSFDIMDTGSLRARSFATLNTGISRGSRGVQWPGCMTLNPKGAGFD